MKLSEAQARLKVLRTRQKKIRLEVDKLRAIIIKHGLNPDDRFNGLKERNKAIYKLYRKGTPIRKLAEKYKIGPERVRQICQRIDYQKGLRPEKRL